MTKIKDGAGFAGLVPIDVELNQYSLFITEYINQNYDVLTLTL